MIEYVIFNLFLITYTNAAYFSNQNNIHPLKAPFMVSIRSKYNQHRCGGALISSRSVITNADCVFNETVSDLILIIGTNSLNQGLQYMPDVFPIQSDNIKNESKKASINHHHELDHLNSIETNAIESESSHSKDEHYSENKNIDASEKIKPSQIFSAKHIYLHKDYDGQFLNNIAVIELDRAVNLKNGVKIIDINHDLFKIHAGDEISGYGWDRELFKQHPAHVISKVRFRVLPSIKCQQIFGHYFKENNELCLEGLQHTPQSGFGGSPVVKDGILYGIMSYGSRKNFAIHPTVAVNLASYTTFLKQVNDDIERKKLWASETLCIRY
uniref:Putative serine protease n=1 Tax=Culicoides nubeculosus TaxID=144565 RepID=B9URK4_CULNU|nr:putative serine protease [Culicoides nubeculosus]